MRRLACLIRTNNILNKNIDLVRGPKKKKQTQGKIQSTDIVNIFKDRQDPEPMQLQHYPIYVQQFCVGPHSFVELTQGIQRNLQYKLPTQSTQKSFLRAIKRQRCKWKNQYVHLNRNPDIFDEKKDFNNRTHLFNLFAKSEDQIKEQQKREQQEAALQAEEDDDF